MTTAAPPRQIGMGQLRGQARKRNNFHRKKNISHGPSGRGSRREEEEEEGADEGDAVQRGLPGMEAGEEEQENGKANEGDGSNP